MGGIFMQIRESAEDYLEAILVYAKLILSWGEKK